MLYVYLAIAFCVLGVGIPLISGWLAVFWLAACSGIVAIVPTVLDAVLDHRRSGARNYARFGVKRGKDVADARSFLPKAWR